MAFRTTSYYFAKSAVVLTIALQFLVSYGRLLDRDALQWTQHHAEHFLGLTVLIRFLSTLAWVSIISFLLLYQPIHHLGFVGYFIGNIL